MSIFSSIMVLVREDERFHRLNILRFCFYCWVIFISYLIRASYIRVPVLVLFWISFALGFLYVFWVFRQALPRILLLLLLLGCLIIAGAKAWVSSHYAIALEAPYEEFRVVTFSGFFSPGWGSDAGGYIQFHKGWKILEEVEVDMLRGNVEILGHDVHAGHNFWNVCQYTQCKPQ